MQSDTKIEDNNDKENNAKEIDEKKNELALRFNELEYQEWTLALKEREIDLRER